MHYIGTKNRVLDTTTN